MSRCKDCKIDLFPGNSFLRKQRCEVCHMLRAEHRIMTRAVHSLVNQAVIKGDLFKPTRCAYCLEIARLHGHHEDYSKPLDVIWLCDSCHKFEHKTINVYEEQVSLSKQFPKSIAKKDGEDYA